MGQCPLPVQPVQWAFRQIREQKFVEPADSWPPIEGQRRNRPPTVRMPPRTSRFEGLPPGPLLLARENPDKAPWPVEPIPDQDEHMSIGSRDQDRLDPTQEIDEDEMNIQEPPLKTLKRPREDPNDEETDQEVELVGEKAYAGPRTREKTKKRKVTFAVQSATASKEFEIVCTRQPDGTVDMEPANLTRMCTLPAEKVSLPYCQNKQAARYHLRNIQLP